ncbi:TonB-dependent receptor plug domain-containing protein [Sphingomonas vulcanisoli]|uniref:TonB-dependent receptor plug domain-containing protein n=1 Tax=Sphingomonas vulcanisoli TaxID=1658060 RepID=UPI001FBB50FF|nr:TonB-dependent receptor [Sphingomonas vulcanisoli]
MALTAASLAHAQTPTAAPQSVTADDSGNEIVVTGTRTAGRSKLDSASPVDVLSAATLRQQGTTELGAALAAVAPSIDFPRASAVDGTDAIRPATLRGLSPDETLVLINGVRGHTAALLNINGSVGRGAAAVDLNTIPTVALDTIEVLRDGASAQYGSDAISGVINLRLRQARSGGGAAVTYGLYDTDINTARGSRSVTGEHTLNASAWQGIGFGSDGYLTISGEYQRRLPTSRGDYDPRITPTAVDSRFGDPSVKQYTAWANAGTSITDSLKLYGWLGYQYRDSTSAAFPRLASATAIPATATTTAQTVAQLYPDYASGFLPYINTHSKDLNSAIGIKGDVSGWTVDGNVSYGRNRIDFSTLNTANYSLGAASPRNFYDGALVYDQLVGGVDVSRKFDVFQSLNVAFGAEGRREGFQIIAGEPGSYQVGPFAQGTFTAQPGAQGFGGFQPSNVITKHRENASIYLDLEAQITEKLLLGLAGRGEHYSDFGSTGTGKVSARYDFSPHFALRGTASTGFRAPSLQQQYFTSTASVIVNNNPVLTGTYPSTSTVGTALGGKPLEPEKSTNLSAGTVIRFGGLDLTVDAYRIHIRNQIGLSENISATFSPQVAALIAATGQQVSAARFFVNGIASTTKGIDAIAHYRLRTDKAGTFDFTVAGNVNKITVTKVPANTAANLNPAPVLFARSRILTIEDGTPGEKVTGTLDWTSGVLGATARVTYYGNVTQPGTTATVLVNGQALTNDLQTGKKAIADLELRYQPKTGVQLALGASNLFDIYPKQAPAYLNTTGVTAYPFYSPWGFNGRYLYVRAGINW